MLRSVLKRKPSWRDRKKKNVGVGEKDLAEKRQPTIDLEVDDDDTGDKHAVVCESNAEVPEEEEEEEAPVEPSSPERRDGPNLCKMIAYERWMDIQELLTTRKDDGSIIDEDGTVTRELIIHHACSHRAPKDIVLSLSSKYWKSLYHADSDGRFPIHIAAINGAGPDMISFLINANSTSAGIKDALGKTPLHYVCEEFLRKNKGTNSLRCHQNMFWTVGLLIKSAPSSVNVEDNEEMNPIELAIGSGAHVGIIKEMQKASRRCWRAREKRGEGCWRNHDEYAQYLQDLCTPSRPPSSKQLSLSNSAA
mmetsp:Transcript_4529/g.6617  ORF Transcript_4529/g.6617 Transcript_4529/m.6617 type:complete len:307 (+) Transcript_4529:133-1053(+)